MTAPAPADVVAALAIIAPEAARAVRQLQALRTACDRHGNLPDSCRGELSALIAMLEARLQ